MKGFKKFLSKAFIPGAENNFTPSAFSINAFIVYGILVMLTMGVLTQGLFIDSFLANITRNLVVQEVNPVRNNLDLPELQENPALSRAAQMKAEDMIRRDYFSHTGPAGEEPWVWYEKTGYDFSLAGENLAIDFNDPSLLMDAWLDSPSHARNILNSYFEDIGIGVARGEFRGRNTTVVVMFLGKEVGSTRTASAEEETAPEENSPPENNEDIAGETSNEEPQQSETEVTPVTKDPQIVPAEELVIAKKADSKVLQTGKETLVGEEVQKLQKRLENPEKSAKNEIISGTPETVRAIFSVFFTGLFFWLIAAAFIYKTSTYFYLPRILLLAAMTIVLWI